MSKAQTDFIEKARAKHGDKYDYTQVVYRGNLNTVTIKCPIHGTFDQVPFNHLRGHGCSFCSIKTTV